MLLPYHGGLLLVLLNLCVSPDCGLRHHLAISYGFATAEALSPLHGQRWDVLSNNEKQIMLAAMPEEIAAMVVDLTRNTAKAEVKQAVPSCCGF